MVAGAAYLDAEAVLIGEGYTTSDQQMIFGVLILLVVAGYDRDARLRDRI